MTALAFVDTETTGLDPHYHEPWEVACILVDSEGVEVERTWQLPVRLGRADSRALTIGRFYERRDATTQLPQFADEFASLTHGAHLVGAVPSFDAAFLARVLRHNGACPGWHYHLVDVEALAAGYLARLWKDHDERPMPSRGLPRQIAHPPWDSNDLSRAVGVEPDHFDRHTALGDARWAKAIYEALLGKAS